MRCRSNKAKNDKDSILAHTKNLLKVLYPALQHMNKIERIEGAPTAMKMSCYGIIHNFTIAKECQEVRLERIHKIYGCFGELIAAFELCITYVLFTDREKLDIAVNIEKIEEGIGKWRNATRSPKSEVRQEVADYGRENLPPV